MKKSNSVNRRQFLKSGGLALAAGSLPLTQVELVYGEGQSFTFAFISDSHITHIKGNTFVRNWDRGLITAVAEANLLSPKPDFVVYGGDIAQLAKKEEIDHGLEILSKLNYETHYVMGEHDYYLDLGQYWRDSVNPKHRNGNDYYSFDHKGVHFVVLNSILTYPEWMNQDWDTPMDRMLQMARLDNPKGQPFMIGVEQLQWLKKDLSTFKNTTPVVVLSHSPLQKIYKGWNFWTEDAEPIQKLLARFNKATVLYGHVHQIQYNQIGNISFHAAMATAWPWPYPDSYTQANSLLPKLTVKMNRADPFFERDATGWQFIDVHSGRSEINYLLSENENRIVGYDGKSRKVKDEKYQPVKNRIPPQTHY